MISKYDNTYNLAWEAIGHELQLKFDHNKVKCKLLLLLLTYTLALKYCKKLAFGIEATDK